MGHFTFVLTRGLRGRSGIVGLACAVALAIVLGAAAVQPAVADPAAPTGALSRIVTGSMTKTIGYQGLVTDTSGTPLDGTVNLNFELWDDETGGSLFGPDITRPGVPVEDGLFTTQLDLHGDALDGRALWLRVQVDGEWLEPRQPLLAAPYALTLAPEAFVYGDSTAPVLGLENAGTGTALRATSTVTGVVGIGQTGLSGRGDVGVYGGGLVGVRGIAALGTGVEGEGDTAGVAGKSLSGPGVKGESQLGDGVHGKTSGGFSAGVKGEGATGVFGLGALVGVSGTSPAPDGVGVMGIVNEPGGTGVEGNAEFGTGVIGEGETGVTGTGSVGAGVEGNGPIGIAGFGDGIAGVLGGSDGGTDSAGVSGENTGLGFGGHFTSAQALGMYAEGVEGVHGEDTSGSGPGVHGVSTNVGVLGQSTVGQGVRGQSDSNDGVVGRTAGTDKSGVFGFNTGNGPGITARSDGGHSLLIPSAGGSGVWIEDTTVHGVHVTKAGAHGIDVAAAGGSGVQVYSADKNGLRVVSAGEAGVAIDSAANDGIRIGSSGWNGLAVDSANYAGVYVASAGGDGMRIQTATKDGLRMFEGIGRDYIYAGSDADPDFRVANDGLVLTDRGFRCGDGAPSCLQTGGADVAEKIDSGELLQAGDVVEIDPDQPDRFRMARSPRSRLVAGVVSSSPAVVLGANVSLQNGSSDDDIRPALALVGRVRVKVSAENGPIAIGDLLVTSSTAGHAMRDADPKMGTVIGKALEALPSGTGTVLVLVQSR